MSAGARDHEWIVGRAEAIRARGATEPRLARDPVNQPAINAWLDAMGDRNPIYRDTPEAQQLNAGPVAPTAMAQVWTMYALGEQRREIEPLHNMMEVLDEAGYTSVLGTNCDQTYLRYLRPGERVSVRAQLESVVGPKQTAMGEGYFVTNDSTWYVGDEQVATMRFRVLKFKPKQRSAAGQPVRPLVNRDSQFFWDGTAAGELRIQKCDACGALRHPPGPMCPSCHETKRSYVVASGRGTVYSYVVHHAPQIPGKSLPLRLGLVELDEGVRMVGELKDDVSIGDRVHSVFEAVDGFTLVSWAAGDPQPPAEPATAAGGTQQPGASSSVGQEPGAWPEWSLPVTATLVAAGAIATRDFHVVHHDHERAVAAGSRDIFLNILSTTGLVQRYVTDHLGPAARIRSCALKLGAPAYPGDTLVFRGTQSTKDGLTVVHVVGTVSLGDHVTATVTVELP